MTLESYDFRHLVVPGLGTEQIATVQTTHPGLAPVEPNVPVFFRRGTQPTVESGIRRPRRLHIGGRVRSPGWEVLDAVSRPEVDHVGNAGDLSRFADGSFAAVYASHVLEHFDYKVAVTSALREWWRVLEPGGRLFVSVPDLSVLSRLFVDRQLTGADRFLVMRMMFGGHDDRYDYHLVGLDEEILTGFLEHAGFEAVTRVSSFGLFDDTSVLELNGTPISLNITATKRQDAPRYDGGATPLARNEHPLPDIRDDAAEISLPEFLDAAGALVGAGKLDDAEACYRHAIAQLAPALHEAGVIALRRAGLEGARALLSAACEMAPDSAKSWLAYGRALVLSARHVEATNALQRAVALDGALADAHALLGLCHGNQGRREEAAIHLERATTLAPDDVLGWKLLGALRWQEGRLSDAEHALKRALASSPNDGDTWNNLGAILHDQHDDISGDLAFHRALEVGPETDYVEHNRLFYATCSSEKSPVEIAALHREWGERISARCVGARRPHMNERAPNRRLRIGYLSPNLNEHSVAFFLKPVLAEHSRDELEVVCFADGGVRDWMTSALEACADRWLDVANLTDDELDAVIRREEIDVLVELAGHSANCRLSLCARCVAPVQVTYLGYPNTTGLSSIQYRITDSYADAPGATEGWHTEELVRPFRSFLCYEPPPRSPAVVAPPCVRKGVTTFGDFNHYRKLNRPTVALWSRVLHAAPGSRLLLKSSAMADPACRTRLFGWLAEEGIAPERVEVAPYKRRLHEHLACYGEMDVALDTFPYNGTTTTCEALWMGVPVVTRFGIDHRSRVGLSLLSNAGFPELAAESDDAFVSAAVRLASDPDGLALRRRTLRDRLRAAPLMDASGFTRALEGAYRSMWRKWCSDGPALGGA
ncbi:MAG TPA: tetratricopeptide repeat protein [Polyangiaceae bacterium]|nr:tetratricopeptide repeat protein [Polyangiaceae bacterium]